MSEELVVREPQGTSLVSVAQIKERLEQVQQLMKTAMQPGEDYGVIPGTGSKPTLLKAGAEKLAMMFQFDAQFETEKHLDEDGHLTIETKCTLYHAPTGNRLGSANAVCSTREAKYAYRKGQRLCPACGKPAIIKGKEEYGGGWVCFKKKGGCGMKYDDRDPDITSQPEGEVANDKLADSYNTVIRMAEKRAYVAAIRLVTACSSIFDEDPDMKGEKPHDQVYPVDHEQPPPYAPDKPKAKSKHPGDDLPDWIDRRKLNDWDVRITSCGSVEELKEVWLAIVHEDPAGKGEKMGVYQAYLKPIKDRQKAALEAMPPTPKDEVWQ